MRPDELAKMFELEDTYWWFVARRQLVRELIERYAPADRQLSILDVGCGTGATLKAIQDQGAEMGLDRSSTALAFSRQRGLRRLAQATAEALPVAGESLDVVLALDLLEHIEDDEAAVKELGRVLRPGGILVVAVPALPELWSEHDEALDHVRRYRGKRLRRLLLQAGLRVEKLSPLILALLAPIAGLRALQRLIPRKKDTPETAFIIPPRVINNLLILTLRLERVWLRHFNLPVGVSLVAVARKP
ncbi:MAG: class I SAM-dependent methyltransferase [Candidatus Eisenbacteria bacterium]|nr:class I SAM-dependent methyltransferase [Candidatus Eisenbacteria bacterium]